jgi:hypothetical protein
MPLHRQDWRLVKQGYLDHHLTAGIFNMFNYKHLIEIDPIKNTLKISRVFEDGVIDFLTETQLPEINDFESDVANFNDFALMLGQNILLDSSYIRDKLKV